VVSTQSTTRYAQDFFFFFFFLRSETRCLSLQEERFKGCIGRLRVVHLSSSILAVASLHIVHVQILYAAILSPTCLGRSWHNNDGSSLKRVSEIVVKFVFNSLFGDLLGALLLALLLLGGSGLLLNAVDLLNHESASDSVPDGRVGEDATVWARHSAGGSAHALKVMGASDLDSLHSGSTGVLREVLNAELAAGGSESTELVALGPVRRPSLVCDSSLEHIRSL
jgi:hypothetical protein